MNYTRTTGALVEIVYVLSDDSHFVMLLQLGKSIMRSIGFHFGQLLSALVIKFENSFRIFRKTLRRSYFHNIITFPEPVTVPERFDAAFSTDSGSGKNCNFHRFIVLNLLKIENQKTKHKPKTEIIQRKLVSDINQ